MQSPGPGTGQERSEGTEEKRKMPRRSPRVNPSAQTSAMPSPQSRGDQRTEQPRVLIACELLLDNRKACCFPERGSWEVRGTRRQCLSSKGFWGRHRGSQPGVSAPREPEPAERLLSWARRIWMERRSQRPRGRGSSGGRKEGSSLPHFSCTESALLPLSSSSAPSRNPSQPQGGLTLPAAL